MLRAMSKGRFDMFHFTDAEKADIIALYQNPDILLDVICEKYGCCRSQIIHMMRRWGIPRRQHGGSRPEKRKHRANLNIGKRAVPQKGGNI